MVALVTHVPVMRVRLADTRKGLRAKPAFAFAMGSARSVCSLLFVSVQLRVSVYICCSRVCACFASVCWYAMFVILRVCVCARLLADDCVCSSACLMRVCNACSMGVCMLECVLTYVGVRACTRTYSCCTHASASMHMRMVGCSWCCVCVSACVLA